MGLLAHSRQRASHRLEIVTNAARQTPDEEIRLQLSRDDYGIIIAVWDADHALPEAKPMAELTLDDLDLSEEAFDDNGGWGLHIVQALAAKCGVTADDRRQVGLGPDAPVAGPGTTPWTAPRACPRRESRHAPRWEVVRR